MSETTNGRTSNDGECMTNTNNNNPSTTNPNQDTAAPMNQEQPIAPSNDNPARARTNEGAEESSSTTNQNAANNNESNEEGPLSQETLDRYKEEKQLLSFRAPPKSIFKNLKGSFWGLMDHIDWAKLKKYRDENSPLDTSNYPGLRKCLKVLAESDQPSHASDKNFLKLAKRLAVCHLCFKNPNIPLVQCAIGCGQHGSSSNIKQHRDRVHQEEQAKKTREESIMEKAGQKKMSSYIPITISRKEVRSEFHHKIFQFVNDMGFPTRTVEKPAFRSLLEYILNNANLLKMSDCSISNRAMTSMRIDSYNDYLRVVNDLGNNIRTTFEVLCGQRIRFASIAHDVWQGCKKDILGITLMLVDPRNCNVYKVPVGLVETKGHSARQIANHTENILNQVGFTQLDLAASINDNTNSAVLAGKYITGMAVGGKCDMHRAELIMKHATGQAVRRRGRTVVDENPAFIKIYKKFHIFASWLMSKKARSRFEKLKEFAAKNGMIVIELQLPNGTRVGGCLIMFHSLFRNKFVMDDYARSALVQDAEFKSKYPSPEEWKQLAEYKAVLQPLQGCSMTLQTDDVSSASASLMEIFMSKHFIGKMVDNGVQVLNVETSSWDPSLTMKKLESKRVNREHALLLPPTKELITHIIREYKRYMLESRDIDAEKAMIGNPLLCASCPRLFKKIKVYDDTDLFQIEKNFKDDAFEKFNCSEVVVPTDEDNDNEGTNQEENVPAIDDADDDNPSSSIFDIFDDLDLAADDDDVEQSGTAANNGNDPVTERARKLEKTILEEFSEYKHYCEKKGLYNWKDLINEYPTPQYLEELITWDDPKKKWFAFRCKKHDFMSVGKYFHVMKWWDAHKSTYPHLFPTALVWLAKPATNAFQERVFSCSSWLDSNRLMRKESPHNFQMRSLTCVSRPVRKSIILSETELAKLPPTEVSMKVKALQADRLKKKSTQGTGTNVTSSTSISDTSRPSSRTAATNDTSRPSSRTAATAATTSTTSSISGPTSRSSTTAVNVPDTNGNVGVGVGVVSVNSATCASSNTMTTGDGVRVDVMLEGIEQLNKYLKEKEAEDIFKFGYLDSNCDNKDKAEKDDVVYADTVEFVDLRGPESSASMIEETVDNDNLLVALLKNKQKESGSVVVDLADDLSDSMPPLTTLPFPGQASVNEGSAPVNEVGATTNTSLSSKRKRKDPPMASDQSSTSNKTQKSSTDNITNTAK